MRKLQESTASLCKPLIQKIISSFKGRDDDKPEVKKAAQQAQNLKWQQEMFHELLKTVRLYDEGLVKKTDVSYLRESILNDVISLREEGEWAELTRDKLVFLQDLFYSNCISQTDYHEAKGLLLIRLIAQGAELDLNDIILLPSSMENSCILERRVELTAKRPVKNAVERISCSVPPAPCVAKPRIVAKTSLRTPNPIHSIVTPCKESTPDTVFNKCSSPLFHSPIDNVVSQFVSYAKKLNPTKDSSSSFSKIRESVESICAYLNESKQLEATPNSPTLQISNRMKILMDFMRKIKSDSLKPANYEESLEDEPEKYRVVVAERIENSELKPVESVSTTAKSDETHEDSAKVVSQPANETHKQEGVVEIRNNINLPGQVRGEYENKITISGEAHDQQKEAEKSLDDVKLTAEVGDNVDSRTKTELNNEDTTISIGCRGDGQTRVNDLMAMKEVETGYCKAAESYSKKPTRTESFESPLDTSDMKTTQPEETRRAVSVVQPAQVDESNSQRISDIEMMKRKLQTKSAAANFFIQKVIGENIRKELRKICIERKQANGTLIFTNDQIEAICMHLPADEIELSNFFPKSWCDKYAEMVLRVVAREIGNHAREMKDVRKAARKKRSTEVKQRYQNDENASGILQNVGTPKKVKEECQQSPVARCFTNMDMNTMKERESPCQPLMSLKTDNRNESADKLRRTDLQQR